MNIYTMNTLTVCRRNLEREERRRRWLRILAAPLRALTRATHK